MADQVKGQLDNYDRAEQGGHFSSLKTYSFHPAVLTRRIYLSKRDSTLYTITFKTDPNIQIFLGMFVFAVNILLF